MIIAVVGKGGVGKTSVASLLLRALLESGQTPVLAVDGDPSSCLGAALGLPASKTLGELREQMRDTPDRPASMSQAEWLALRVQEAIVENRGFDLLTMGRPEGKGCYCFVNNLIRDHLDRLGRSYRHVLVDCEAGLEHLSRRTTGRPDRLVCVTNRARMAAETIHRTVGLFLELHGELPGRVELVLNGLDRDDPAARELIALAGGGSDPFTKVLTVPMDAAVASHERVGRSLLELGPDSPAWVAVRGWEVGA